MDDFMNGRVRFLNDGHWQWLGQRDQDGFGVAVVGRRKLRAHRYVYMALRGPASHNLVQTCGYRFCVNPDHQADGLHAKPRKTHCVRGHEFNQVNARTVGRRRYCRICDRIRHRRTRGDA